MGRGIWRALVESRCPPGRQIQERAFRLTPTDILGGDLRSAIYAGVVTRHADAVVPRYICAWVLRGSGWFADETGHRHAFRPGCCFQRFPDRLHTVYFDRPDSGAYWFAGLPPAFVGPLQDIGFADPVHPVFEPGCDIRLLRRAFALHDTLGTAPEDVLAPCLAETFAVVCALHQAARSRRQQRHAPWLDRAIQGLLSGTRSVEAIAHDCGCAPSTFRIRFARATGLKPSQWRIRRRVVRAQQWLLEGVAIAEIAARLGYPGVPAFTRQFTQAVGSPPAAWRRRQAGAG